MNKLDRDREKLLAETFGGDWDNGPSAGFSRRAAAAARRQRFVRKAIVASSAAAGIAAAVALAVFHRPLRPEYTGTSVTQVAAAPAYEVISDDELLAQLRDRPVLAVRKENGSREIVLLEN